MRSILFHCKNYKITIKDLANRPYRILPEQVYDKEQVCHDCVVALITIEEKDSPKFVSLKIAQEIGRETVVLLPFAHLSNNLAKSKISIQTMDLIEEHLKQKVKVLRGHFGSHKELLIDIYGHPGNVRYREF